VLGHVAPRLRIAGKVPLGTFGAVRTTSTGASPFTDTTSGAAATSFRSGADAAGQVRDLSTPYAVAIRAHNPPLVRRGVRLESC
jgi:hypothetical protein